MLQPLCSKKSIPSVLRDRNVGTLECIGSLAIGSALVAYGLSRRSTAGVGVAAAGTTLIVRGATGHCPVYSSLGVTRPRRQRR